VSWSASTSLRLAAGALLVGLAIMLVPGESEANGRPPRPWDLQVALRVDGECGSFGDSLPALIVDRRMAPGERAGVTGICVRNAGPGPGRLFLSVTDRTEEERGCTGDEATVDATCGAGTGELGQALVVAYATQPRCKGDLGSAGLAGLASLDGAPRDLGLDLKAGATGCLALDLWYRLGPTGVVEASQSDAISWRYAFDLVERP
jgi:hypothetical protein